MLYQKGLKLCTYNEDTWLCLLSLLMYVMFCSTWEISRSERCHCVWKRVEDKVVVGYNQQAFFAV
jgi:hypothetical protein